MQTPKFKIKQLQKSLSRRDWIMLLVGALAVIAVVKVVHIIHVSQAPLKRESPGITIKWIPSTVRHWDNLINEMAKQYNIDPNLIAIIMTLESGGYSKAGSEAGAQGLMQVTPLTAQDIAAKFVKKSVKKYDLFDPKTSIEFGTAYLAYLRDEFGTYPDDTDWLRTVELVAAGYNGGPGTANALEKGEGLRDVEPVIYSRDAFNMWRERRAKTSPTFDRWKERGGIDLINLAKEEQNAQK